MGRCADGKRLSIFRALEEFWMGRGANFMRGHWGARGWGPSHITKVLEFELYPQGHRKPIEVLSVEEREELLSDMTSFR